MQYKAQMHDGKIVLQKSTPIESAAIFRSERRPHMLVHQEQWYDYDGRGYAVLENKTIEQDVQRFLEGCLTKIAVTDAQGKLHYKYVPFNPTPPNIADVAKLLNNELHHPREKVTPPSFIDGGMGEYAGLDPRKIIAMENGLLYLPTRKLLPHTSTFFTLNVIPVTYDPKAPAPVKWLKFLREAMLDRETLVELLHEMMGYGLDADTSMQKIFFFWGEPAGGKGTIMRIQEALAGKGNCSHPSIADLNNTFGLEHCIEKSNLFITDMNVKRDLDKAADVLKAVSGEDTRNFNRKNKTFWHGALTGRIWIGANRLPDFGSDATALNRRLLVLPFEASFVGREDFGLTAKLMAELPGIFNLCLEGLANLRKRGRFLEPAESREAKRRMLLLSEPIRGLIDYSCVTGKGYRIDKDVMFQEYLKYCEHNGEKRTLAKNKFSEALMSSFPQIGISRRPRAGAGGGHVQVYTGVRLNPQRAVAVYLHDLELVALYGDRSRATIRLDEAGAPTLAVRGSDFDEYEM